ncbi:hypothetical protein H4R18_004216 [Coemansia javaensis]|uniref:Uncharacterized protein n=1 Tax=Coemansia javaensis TaxID=2761396 RepID=A0A9W8H4W2_9FUNG|nr:hypothetical protein H4R18_004216 [Coemansia javaensis]
MDPGADSSTGTGSTTSGLFNIPTDASGTASSPLSDLLNSSSDTGAMDNVPGAARKLASGAIAGIAVAAVVISICAAAGFLLWRRRKRARRFYRDDFAPPDVGTASSTYLADTDYVFRNSAGCPQDVMAHPPMSQTKPPSRAHSVVSAFHDPISAGTQHIYLGPA